MSSTDVSDGTTTALGHGLKVRHLTMMGLGSAIGAGLVSGRVAGWPKSGPPVLLSYFIAGALVVFGMGWLG